MANLLFLEVPKRLHLKTSQQIVPEIYRGLLTQPRIQILEQNAE